MRVLLLVAAFFGCCELAECDAWGLHNDTATQSRRFIVEIDQGGDLAMLKADLESRPGSVVLKTFNNRIFRGVSVESSSENLDSLKRFGSIANVWRSTNVELSPVIDGGQFMSDSSALNYSIHHMTGVERLHQEGILGNGVTVAVVDTGIDYNHSALGGGYGPGFKIAGGYDLVGENWYPRSDEAKQPDDDPRDLHGHGTHVAGIIAGETENWVGVAPEATLFAYKVFGMGGGTDEETLIEAFLRAYDDGVDIITASIGGPGGWSTSAWGAIASRIVEDGTLVTISAGNSGGVGAFFGSNGSSGKFVLAVASIDADTLPALPFKATTTVRNTSTTATFAYIPGSSPFPTSLTDRPVMPLSLNVSDFDVGCRNMSDGHSLADVVVLSPLEGGCSIYTRITHLLERGAMYVLFYNDTEVAVPQAIASSPLHAGIITFDAAKNLTQTILNGAEVKVDFADSDLSRYVGIQNSAGGVASYFTSLAALFDLQIKPDIAAPGGNIFSTYLDNTFQVMSGTSMACPYVAGIAALYIGKHGGRAAHGRGFARQLAMRIMSSGRAVRWSDGSSRQEYGQWAPVFQVGTGLIDARAVLKYNTSLSWAKFALNDTDFHQRQHRLSITNNGPRRERYRFSLQPAGGLEAMDTSTDPALIRWGPDPAPPLNFQPTAMRPEVDFPEDVWVDPGSTKTAEFSIGYPAGLQAENLPIYSGKILISSTNAEELSVPYLGVGASINDTFRNIYHPGFPKATTTLEWTSLDEKPYFSFNLSRQAQDFPKLDCAFRWGVRQFRWDIFEPGWEESSWTYPPVAGRDGYIGAATSWAYSGYFFWFDPEQNDVEDVVSFPLQGLTRSMIYSYWWMGRMADGTMIQPGNYTMRIAALVPNGDPHKAGDWAVFRVPETQITRPADFAVAE